MQKTTYKLAVSDRVGRINSGRESCAFWLDITNLGTGAHRTSRMIKFGSGKWEERERCSHGELHQDLENYEPWAVFSREAGADFQELMHKLFLDPIDARVITL